jgi:hypothetical protein
MSRARFKSWDSFSDFSDELAHRSRFVRSKESEQFLRAVSATCKKRIRQIKKGTILWRAQLGHEWRMDEQIGEELPVPFNPARMFPLPGRASEGRVNSKGIPCLYLGTTRDSAMSEVRPWLGSLISVAQLEIKRDLRIIDCSIFHDRGMSIFLEQPPPPQIEKSVWGAIDRAFAEPVTRSDETAEYSATQAIAELFRSNGYDGVVYKSSFGKRGFNVALFDTKCAKLLNCSLYKARNVQIDFHEDANPYFVVKKKRGRSKLKKGLRQTLT